MIPATHPYEARFTHKNDDGRTTFSFKPVIAWDDDGQPLVAGKRKLMVASSFTNFDRIMAADDSPVVATVPGDGWRAEFKDEDGSTISDPVIAFAVRADGTGLPIQVGSDGEVDTSTSASNFSRLYHAEGEQA